MEEAVKRKVFARGFKREVRVAAGSGRGRPSACWSAALDALAIAGKAGLAVTGFAKVEAAIAREKVVALIHAADAAPTAKRKLDGRIAPRDDGKAPEIAVIEAF